MSLGKIEILLLYKNNMLEFLDNLIELCPEESELIMFRILLENQIPIEDAISNMAKVMIPLKEVILKKDERFFLDENDIFGKAKQDKVIKWKQVWVKKNLNKSDRDAIWKWIDLFLKLCEMYVNHEAKSLEAQ